MRFSPRALLAVVLSLLCVALVAPGEAVSAPAPDCATGPATVGDVTYGTPCADVIVVPPGVEAVQAGGGDDTIVPARLAASAPCPSGCFLGIGSQTFDGGPGDDVVYGQRGNDTLRGGEGNDHLFGGIGDDLLRGGPGNDRLAGGFGADSIDGESGDDYVHGDGTIDRISDSGGDAADTLSYASGITPGFGAGITTGYAGFPPAAEGRGVYLTLGSGGENGNNGVASFGGGVDEIGAGIDRVIGTPFSDYIVGSGASETIYGGAGADVILGEGGEDVLFGGADGDGLEGGTGGDAANGGPGEDHCDSAAAETSCETASETVDPRDPTKVSVGLMTPGEGGYSQLYLVGSESGDIGTATYGGTSVTFSLSAGSFDESADAAAGCSVAATQATCPLSTPLDSVVLAGMGGNDSFSANGFPSSTTMMMLGGEGGDGLTGGNASEDVLVDGPDGNGDVLSALGADDALLHNGGPDLRLGGDGNDLFLSVSTCDGDQIRGEAGRDNASWARLKDEGAGANLGIGTAGEPTAGGVPSCASGALDSLQEIEDLEGSLDADVFYGDSGPNQLLGHFGPDVYEAGPGDDTILANSGDADASIDCGPDIDRALIDHPVYGDPAPVNCEAVREADPNSFQSLPGFPIPTPPPPPPTTTPAKKARPKRADRKPPRTRITAHPRAVLTTAKAKRRVVFRFSSNESRSRFRCRLDRQPYRACRSPQAYLLAPGRHAIRIFAIDRAGNADPSPALFSLRIRRR